MNLINVSSLILATMLLVSTSQASINTPNPPSILSSQQKCVSALNHYLSSRRASILVDDYKIQQLEKRVDTLCDGYQIKLVKINGTMTGVIETTN